jgi:hypothetical protein
MRMDEQGCFCRARAQTLLDRFTTNSSLYGAAVQAGASVDYDESSDAMVTVLSTQVASLMREKKALLAEMNLLSRDNQSLEERVKYLAAGSVYDMSAPSPGPGGSPSYD